MTTFRRRSDLLDQTLDKALGSAPGALETTDGIAVLLRALRTPLVAEGTLSATSEVELMVAMAETARSRAGRSRWSRLRVLGTTTAAKMIIAGSLVLGGTAAAAATGSLPQPVQRAVAQALAGVGLHVSGWSPPKAIIARRLEGAAPPKARPLASPETSVAPYHATGHTLHRRPLWAAVPRARRDHAHHLKVEGRRRAAGHLPQKAAGSRRSESSRGRDRSRAAGVHSHEMARHAGDRPADQRSRP